MPGYKIGLPPGFNQGPIDQQAIWYECAGFGHYALITAIMSSSDPLDQQLVQDWHNRWLIRYQCVLWAIGYTHEERAQVRAHVDSLRVAGRYPEEFRFIE